MKSFKKGYGFIFKSVSLFLLILGFCLLSQPSQAAENSYKEELKADAISKNLHEKRFWRALLHYKPKGKGVESLVDDPLFFMSPDGKTNPEAELKATIDGFFDEITEGDSHPQCRFPARLRMLKKELSIDSKKLITVSCPGLDDAMAKINPKTAAMVFSAAHINAPASMFGHTFLRLDSDKESKLLSYAANYAALATDKNGFVYVFKGLAGYYKGYYTLLPYYQKVAEYNDMDQRDIWEYRLNFTEEEVKTMVEHLWELKDIYTYYYFFDENCSYIILFILEAARPELHVTEGYGFSVIPVDTLRELQKEGLIEDVSFRPSRATTIKRIAAKTGKKYKRLAVEAAFGRKPTAELFTEEDAKDDRIRTLDLAAEYSQYLYSKKKLEREEYQKIFLSILKERGALGKSESVQYDETTPLRPESGHLSKRVAIGLGTDNKRFYEELKWRPAYHTLLDPADGFIAGSQIEFFSLGLRHYPKRGNVELESFVLVNILSLTPRDMFFKPLSWKIRTGIEQRIFPDKDDHAVYRTAGGAGFVYQLDYARPYATADGIIDLSGRFEKNSAAGGGATLGIISDIAGPYTAHFYLRGQWFVLGEKHRSHEAVLSQSYKLNQNMSISVDLKRERTFDVYSTRAGINLNYFFN